MKKTNRYIVILAGGKGERLWPLSRKELPKQLLPFGGGGSLLAQTIGRVQPFIKKEQLWIITTKQQKKLIDLHAGSKVGTVLAEPCSRNTAPAILLTCLQIMKHDKDAVIAFLPADHYIKQEDIFRKNLNDVLEFSEKNDYITLLGAQPQWPATGYGYIEYEKIKKDTKGIPHKVNRFHEKPSLSTAKLYVTLSNMLWNIGIVCGKVSTFIEEYKKTAPAMVADVQNYVQHKGSYDQCENSSIDHSVLEKSNATYVLPVDFGWSDVGNLDIFLSLRSKHQGVSNRVITVDAHDNIVDVPQKLVALIDVENLCIVETDDVLLITKRDQTDKVKNVLAQLKNQNEEGYL